MNYSNKHSQVGTQHMINGEARNATLRRIKHGPIRPMVEPTFLQRLFGRN